MPDTTAPTALKLSKTNDPMVWAETFCLVFQGKVVTVDDSEGVDTGLMVAWFANAMAAQEMAAHKTRAAGGVITRRECKVCGGPDVYPRCDCREWVDRRYVAVDAVEHYYQALSGLADAQEAPERATMHRSTKILGFIGFAAAALILVVFVGLVFAELAGEFMEARR